MEFSPTTFVSIDGSSIRLNVANPAEAKVALKELKLKKKEYGLLKREIALQQKEVRSAYTNEVATRGSRFMGGGGLGRFVRAVQTISRDSKRAEVANRIAPLEQRSMEIEAVIHAIDSTILQVEAYLLKGG